jgi:hypothetical protein
MIDHTDALSAIFALAEHQSAYPTELFDKEIAGESGHFWIAKHARKFSSLQTSPSITPDEMIDQLMTIDMDTMIDNLLSIAITLMDTIEYCYSSNALAIKLSDESLDEGRTTFTMLNTVTGQVTERTGMEDGFVRDSARALAERRIPDLPMQMDHLNQVIGAIRVCCGIKEARTLPVLSPAGGNERSRKVEEFAKGGVEVNPESLPERVSRFLHPEHYDLGRDEHSKGGDASDNE